MALPTTNLSLNAIHVEVGGTSGALVSMNDADVRGINFSNTVSAGSDGISTTSGSQISFGEFRDASEKYSATLTLGYQEYASTTLSKNGTGTTNYFDRVGFREFFFGSLTDTTFDNLSNAPILNFYWDENALFGYSGGTCFFFLIQGLYSDSGWSTITIGSTTISRTSADYYTQYEDDPTSDYALGYDYTTWQWGGTHPTTGVQTNFSNPFGTLTSGTTFSVTIT
jgi:hypothetical protein